MAAPRKIMATTIDEYLAGVSADQRAALQKIRKSIRAIVPQAEERINYGIAAFFLHGKAVAGLGAGKNHCTYFPMSGSTVATLKNDLKGYDTSKGAVRFAADKPLPQTLLRKLIKARIAEIGERSARTAVRTMAPKALRGQRRPR